jgi:hypothetical protein
MIQKTLLDLLFVCLLLIFEAFLSHLNKCLNHSFALVICLFSLRHLIVVIIFVLSLDSVSYLLLMLFSISFQKFVLFKLIIDLFGLFFLFLLFLSERFVFFNDVSILPYSPNLILDLFLLFWGLLNGWDDVFFSSWDLY